MTVVSRLPGPKFVEIAEVAVEGDRVWFCSGVRGLNAVDARDPANMTVTWKLSPSLGSARYPRCQHVAVAKDRVFLTNRGDHIQPVPFVTAFDTSVSPPRELASFSRAGLSFEGIAAAGAFVYVAMHGDGLAVLELVDRSLVQRGVATGLTNAWGVAVTGDYVYVADGPAGFAVVDVSSPHEPRVVSTLDVPGNAQAVAVDPATHTAWVAAGAGGVIAVDVRNPAEPVIAGKVSTPGSALQVAVGDGVVFVADWNDVRVIDSKDPSAPRVIASERLPVDGAFPRVLGIGARGTTAFAGEWTGLYSLRAHPERTAPDLWLDQGRVDFGDVSPGTEVQRSVFVENHGTEPLAIREIRASSPAIRVASAAPVTLRPGGVHDLQLRLAPGASGAIAGTVELVSNDPDEPVRTIAVAANGPGVGVGDAVPELVLSGVDGGSLRLSDFKGDVVLLSYFATF